MSARPRPLAIAVAVAIPLLVAGCSRTYSSGQEFRNQAAFAALKADGSVVAWGSPTRGGDPACTINPANCAPAPAGSLSSGVVNLFSNYGAFAALKAGGSVAVWGGLDFGGSISCTNASAACHPATASSLASGVVDVSSTYQAFAARKSDGSVATWGENNFGGDAGCTPHPGICWPAPAGSLSSGVTKVWGSYDAFAALKADGTVVAWGDPTSGGDASSPVGGTLTGIVDVVPNGYAFAAKTGGGGVVVWGDPGGGGDPTCASFSPCAAAPAGSLASGVVDMNSTNEAFAARKADGSVVTWGVPTSGGNSSAPIGGSLTGVRSIAATDKAFAAVKSDGSVVVWGDGDYGGNPTCSPPTVFCSPAPPGSLAGGVVSIVATRQAFAALKSDGSVVAWGAEGYGGNASCTPGYCTPAPAGTLSGGVTDITWTQEAFFARKRDGSVVTWGATPRGGDSSSPIGGPLQRVASTFATNGAGAAITESGAVVTWGDPDVGGDPTCTPVPSGTCSPAPAGSLSSGVVYIASPFVPLPSQPGSPGAASASGGASPSTPTATPRLAGRTTCTPRRCVSKGRLPAGATSVTQAATSTRVTSGSARSNARTTLRTRGRCTTAKGAYTCTIRLAAGRWTITTRALAGRTVVASSVKRVRIPRASARGAVTG
ncbi:MAG: hypothetical protein KGQ95_03430 [Acidobacteria bacterium]|nr:hypothetical protein [Acidobacteriota bacterium]